MSDPSHHFTQNRILFYFSKLEAIEKERLRGVPGSRAELELLQAGWCPRPEAAGVDGFEKLWRHTQVPTPGPGHPLKDGKITKGNTMGGQFYN